MGFWVFPFPIYVLNKVEYAWPISRMTNTKKIKSGWFKKLGIIIAIKKTNEGK